ncbi:hypothetical protein FRC04_004078 [Tulasnella sp. 424]|nr:hypothetical protein FRC04_004078 [Tulasnella sp. 424]KAG8964509.1 hypothetical protein FRC05_003790 [Tulasnella sp. 425]
MQAGSAPPRILVTEPVFLQAIFPETPGFRVPPLDIDAASTITIDPEAAFPGGYAEVFRGSWVPPGKTERETIAVKIFRARGNIMSEEGEMEQHERIVKRLAREVTIWQTLNSKRIVPLYGYIPHAPIPTHKDRPCAISPWRRQGSLAKFLRDHPQTDRLALLIQAAEAVNVLHTAPVPIVHLDIKPDNFIVNDDNEVELSDFGISRLLNGAPSGFTTGTGSATYAFAAPEYMLNPELYSTALDVYSFGLFMLAA